MEDIEKEMYSLYKELEGNTKLRMAWIKKKLPWYIIGLCKVASNEIRYQNAVIFVGVNFGNSAKANCYIEITPRDIDMDAGV